MFDQCNCARCSGGETPEEFEVCPCADCHFEGGHEDPCQWLTLCELCAEEAP